jgi:pimeloyl-ACP methyl ester carboxylesterase
VDYCRIMQATLPACFILGLLVVTSAQASDASDTCGLRSASIDVDSGQIYYDRAGDGQPIILLHGLFAQKEQWQGVLCGLASAGFDAIAPDLPGFGQSSGYSLRVYDLQRQVRLLGQFADGLGLSTFDLAANSLGGAIAALYVQGDPARVRRLAFVGPPLGVEPWGPGVRTAILRGINPFIPTDQAQFGLEMGLLFVQPPEVPDEMREALIQDYVVRNRHYRQVWDIVNLFDDVLAGDGDEPLGIDIPVLIVWGEGDSIYPVSAAPTLRQRLPGSQLVVLPETGHLPMLERTAETQRLLSEFFGADARSSTSTSNGNSECAGADRPARSGERPGGWRRGSGEAPKSLVAGPLFQ